MKLCLKNVMMKAKENELIKDLREKQLKTKEAFEDNKENRNFVLIWKLYLLLNIIVLKKINKII